MTLSTGWTTPICEAIRLADQPKQIQHRTWHRDLLSIDRVFTCVYCQSPVDASSPKQSVINYLVPTQLGGPLVDENRVLSCFACARGKGHKDLVSWSGFHLIGDASHRQALLHQRLKVLSVAPNHLTQTRPNAPRATVIRELNRRWDNPRFTLYALHGVERSWIGWTARNGAKDALALAAVLLRYSCQAVSLQSGKVTLYELPSDKFLDAVWVLIEHHALVKQLAVDGVDSVPQDPDNWQHYWPLHLEHLSDLQRRRPRLTGNNARTLGTLANAKMLYVHHGIEPCQVMVERMDAVEKPRPAPRKPREMSTSKAAIGKRKRRSRNQDSHRLQSFMEARAVLDSFKERVRQGKVIAPSTWELDLMERDVLAILDNKKDG